VIPQANPDVHSTAPGIQKIGRQIARSVQSFEFLHLTGRSVNCSPFSLAMARPLKRPGHLQVWV